MFQRTKAPFRSKMEDVMGLDWIGNRDVGSIEAAINSREL